MRRFPALSLDDINFKHGNQFLGLYQSIMSIIGSERKWDPEEDFLLLEAFIGSRHRIVVSDINLPEDDDEDDTGSFGTRG